MQLSQRIKLLKANKAGWDFQSHLPQKALKMLPDYYETLIYQQTNVIASLQPSRRSLLFQLIPVVFLSRWELFEIKYWPIATHCLVF